VKNITTYAKREGIVGKLYKKCSSADSGARGSTLTFVDHQIGDVLLAWEN